MAEDDKLVLGCNCIISGKCNRPFVVYDIINNYVDYVYDSAAVRVHFVDYGGRSERCRGEVSLPP